MSNAFRVNLFLSTARKVNRSKYGNVILLRSYAANAHHTLKVRAVVDLRDFRTKAAYSVSQIRYGSSSEKEETDKTRQSSGARDNGQEQMESGLISKLALLKAKAKLMWKQYGVVAVATYTALYIGMLGASFSLLHFEYVPATDIVQHIGNAHQYISETFLKIGYPLPSTVEYYIEKLKHSIEADRTTRNMAIALVSTELAEPFRQLLVICLTPFIARAIGRVPKKM